MKDCSLCVIRNRAVCAALQPDELELLGKLGRRQAVERGQLLVRQGDDRRIVANVVSGMLKVSMSMADGREQIVSMVFPGDFIGRPFGDANPYSVSALGDAEVCVFSGPAFDEFASTHPALEHKLLRRTLDELDRARTWMLLLGRKAAQERIATLLLALSDRLGETGCSAGDGALDSFELPLDRRQMSDLLGLTIETVSRQMSQLKADGVIALPNPRTVAIQDRDRLVEIAAAA